MTCSGWMTTHRCRSWPKEANLVNLFLHIWQLRMPTLNQRLGSFPTESRAAIFPQCRQDYPLPPPINRGGFQGLKEEKIRSKVSQKISIFSVSTTFSLSFCLSLSLRRGLRSPPFLPPSFHHRLHYQRLLELLTNRPPSSHRDSLSSPSSLSLSSANFFLLPPLAESGHHSLSRRLLSHRPNHLITSETPTPGNFLLPTSPLSSSSWLLHAEFISTCSA